LVFQVAMVRDVMSLLRTLALYGAMFGTWAR